MNLKIELQKFWDWAQLTPEEYESGLPPRNNNIYMGAEWEDEYPEFQILEKVFIREVSRKDNFNNDEFIKLVLQSIAIDNERENFSDFIIRQLESKKIEKVYDNVLNSNLIEAQRQLASRVLKSDLKNKVSYLKKFMNLKDNKHASEVALYLYNSLGL